MTSVQSPMMKQFQAAKERCPEAIVLFRMGDFYELFHDDARRAADLLDLTLTSREKGPHAVPMAGFPFHQLDIQLPKLVAAGCRVAICEQIDDPKTTKGLLRREVTRVVTPGLADDDSLLDPSRSTFLASIVFSRHDDPNAPVGIAWIDVAAGRFLAASLSRLDAAEQLSRLECAECLVSVDARSESVAVLSEAGSRALVTARPEWWFETSSALSNLSHALSSVHVEGLGFELPEELSAIAAAGAIIQYLKENEPAAITRIKTLSVWRPGRTMEIDDATRRGLELIRTIHNGRREGTLLSVLDHTKCPMGARLLGEWITSPLVDRLAIDERLNAVGVLVANEAMAESLTAHLTGIGDLERAVGRASSGRAGPRDLERIGKASAAMPLVQQTLSDCSDGLLAECREWIDPCLDVTHMVTAALVDGCPQHARDGNFIRSGFDEKLDQLRELSSGGKQWIASYQATEIIRTGIPTLKVGFNRVFGYYIEVSRSHAAKVPPEYQRKQTVKSAERYVTTELEQRQHEVLGAEDAATRREHELLETLRSFICQRRGRLMRSSETLAIVDVLTSFSRVARSRGWCRPTISDDPELLIDSGRHPVLEELLPPGSVVANDVPMPSTFASDPRFSEGKMLLVTGPNMGGKSTFIRQAALITILAQSGSFVPAKSARIGIVDRLFARIGSGDDLAKGASTFLVEMTQAARIMNRSTRRSLVILDEVGRGTSTFDGLAIAQAVIEYLHDAVGCRTLFATHYLQLASLKGRLPRLDTMQVLVEQWRDTLVFLHRIAPGAADKSFGVHVARMAGVPDSVIGRAQELLAKLEGDSLTITRKTSKLPSLKGSEDAAYSASGRDDELPLFSKQR